jgi:hypothetical protein
MLEALQGLLQQVRSADLCGFIPSVVKLSLYGGSVW